MAHRQAESCFISGRSQKQQLEAWGSIVGEVIGSSQNKLKYFNDEDDSPDRQKSEGTQDSRGFGEPVSNLQCIVFLTEDEPFEQFILGHIEDRPLP